MNNQCCRFPGEDSLSLRPLQTRASKSQNVWSGPLSQNPRLLPLTVALITKLSQPGQIKQETGTSSSINPFEASLNFYHFFLDSEKVFRWSQGWRKADKCQRLIAKLRTEQRGSGETEQRKWHSVVEMLSCSDSYHSGHHELMPGCLMQVSEPKEHLSVTSAISTCEGFAAAAARPCQSWSRGCELTDGKFSPRFVNVVCVIWSVSAAILGRHLQKRTHHLQAVIYDQGAEIVPVSRETWQMSWGEENQPACVTLWNIICQGQFVFAVRCWCIAFAQLA